MTLVNNAIVSTTAAAVITPTCFFRESNIVDILRLLLDYRKGK
jgi:hypothetical protein